MHDALSDLFLDGLLQYEIIKFLKFCNHSRLVLQLKFVLKYLRTAFKQTLLNQFLKSVFLFQFAL